MTPPLLPFPAVDQVTVTVEGVTDAAQRHAIVQGVRGLCRHRGGMWRATVRPCDGRGRWHLELRGASGRHVWSFAAAPPDLPHMIAGKLRAFL